MANLTNDVSNSFQDLLLSTTSAREVVVLNSNNIKFSIFTPPTFRTVQPQMEVRPQLAPLCTTSLEDVWEHGTLNGPRVFIRRAWTLVEPDMIMLDGSTGDGASTAIFSVPSDTTILHEVYQHEYRASISYEEQPPVFWKTITGDTIASTSNRIVTLFPQGSGQTKATSYPIFTPHKFRLRALGSTFCYPFTGTIGFFAETTGELLIWRQK